MVAVRVQDGTVLPLIAENTNSVPDDIRQAMIYPQTGPSQPLAKYLISPDGLLLTYNPAWMINHNLRNITLQRANQYNGQEIWQVEMPVDVYSLAWTQESKNLLAGAQTDQPGPVFRMNASTGENQQLVDDIFWIGVQSNLQARSMNFVPHVNVSLATGNPTIGWICNGLAKYSIDRICVAPYWDQGSLPEGNDTSAPVYISNLVFNFPYGWATQIPGSIRIGIFVINDWRDSTLVNIPESLAQVKGILWDPITIDGIHGVHLLVGYSVLQESISINNISYSDLLVGHSDQTEIILPLPSGECLHLTVTADVDGGFNNPVVQRILQSIVIRK